jgi:hypothetical protein
MVTDFVEHIDDVVDALERLRDFHRRRHFFKLGCSNIALFPLF